ncbi:MAG: FUSC family protein [Gammaproteobacteria bacterium]
MRTLFQRSVFSIANTAAVLVALYIAFALNLERPYWAMFSVFIVAMPLSGAVRSKAVYRLLGTIIGASGALLLVPPLVQSPTLLCLAMAAWVGVWLWLSLLDRTPRSYAPMLAGYTATIVGLSVVNAPEAIFDTTVARVEEISIGIVCGAVAHSIFFPRNVAEELNGKIAAALRACANWTANMLSSDVDPSRRTSASQQLSQIVTELHMLNTHVAFDNSNVPLIGRHIQVLQNRLAVLLPQLASAQLAIGTLRSRGELRSELASLVDETTRWTRALADAPDVLGDREALPSRLRAHFAAAGQSVERRRDWSRLLEHAATTHLHELVETLEDCRLLARATRDPDSSLPPDLEREVRSAKRIPLPRDTGLAFLSAGAAIVAVLVSCVLWIGGSWPEGAVAAQFAAIGCSMFATLDKPSGLLSAALIAVLLALPFAALYQFAILPRVDGFVSLALVLSPLLLLLSFMQTFKKLEGAALILAISFSGGLALQSTYQADFAVFVNTNAAEIVGVLIAIAVNLVFRTIDPRWNALRISRAAWRALSRWAESGGRKDRGWPTQMLDRLGQVTIRLKSVTAPASSGMDVLRDLRVGVNVAAIASAEENLDPGLTPRFDAIRQLVSEVYQARSRAQPEPPEAGIERSIDLGIAELEAGPASEWQSRALAGLVTLRLDLAPAAVSHSTQAGAT